MDKSNTVTFSRVDAIKRATNKYGISFRTWSNDWVMELRYKQQVRRIINRRFDVNDVVSSMIAQDKVATYIILTDHGIPSLPHVLYGSTNAKMIDKVLPGKIVAKPLVGDGGKGVRLFVDIHRATLHLEALEDTRGWTLSPYVEIRKEARIIIMDSEVLLSYAKQPVIINGLKMFNLSLGAVPYDNAPNDEAIILAIDAAKAIGLRLAMVDIIETDSGEQLVIEVNDSLSVDRYAKYNQRYCDQSYGLYDNVVGKLFAKK